ncbi:MAG TPA: LUD domain-containing protein [Puia sp.]|nr:LUD domain-containing protein [Puia sp.]
MKISPAKENILKKIRKALSQSTPLPFPNSEGNSSVFKAPDDDLEVVFAREFTKLQGKFAFCRDLNDFRNQLDQLIENKAWNKIYYGREADEGEMTALIQGSLAVTRYSDDIASCDASLTLCECLVARTGSIVLSATQKSGGRTSSVYAPVHVCVAYTRQVVFDIKDGLQLIKEKYKSHLPSLISFATGPSRTADIEKTLVVGVHGPKEVYLFLVDQQS